MKWMCFEQDAREISRASVFSLFIIAIRQSTLAEHLCWCAILPEYKCRSGLPAFGHKNTAGNIGKRVSRTSEVANLVTHALQSTPSSLVLSASATSTDSFRGYFFFSATSALIFLLLERKSLVSILIDFSRLLFL